MERKKYLELCQKAAMLSDGLMGIKQNVPDELKVVVDGIAYYPLQRVTGFDGKGSLVLFARLHDIKANCVVECPIEKVKEYKNEENN